VRVYVPATLSVVRELVGSGLLPAPVQAVAVTPELREWYVDDDPEVLEFAALNEAARASLRLLAADPEAPQRRVVLAVDIDDGQVGQAPALGRGAVEISAAVTLPLVAAAHVDEPEAVPVISRAASLLSAADGGDQDAELAVGDAEDLDLLWYASQELPDLL
jgi:hypothetical protein